MLNETVVACDLTLLYDRTKNRNICSLFSAILQFTLLFSEFLVAHSRLSHAARRDLSSHVSVRDKKNCRRPNRPPPQITQGESSDQDGPKSPM